MCVCVYSAHYHLYKSVSMYCLYVNYSALSGARSQEFHSPRHTCCGHVTIKVIYIYVYIWCVMITVSMSNNTLYIFTYRQYVLSICKLFCTVWSTLSRISLTKAHVLWSCDNKSDIYMCTYGV